MVKVGLFLPVSVEAFLNLSVAVGGRAGTTRYWDCSGGACGATIPGDSIACPNSDCSYPWGEPKCSPHDWAPRWMQHEGGNILYAAAAASDLLYCGQGSDCKGWGDGATCGKCYLLTNPGGCSSGSPKLDKMIVRVSNLCPGKDNPVCKDQYHFDISAPGFDDSGTSVNNVCTNGAATCDASVSGSDACAHGSIEDCDCSQVSSDPVLVEGCKNFKLLGWDNCEVDFEETPCPTEPASGPGPAPAPVDPVDPTAAPVDPATTGSPSQDSDAYCPSAQDLVVAYGSNVALQDQGWTVNGDGGAATKAAYNLNGGYVEYDLDVSGATAGTIPNVYSIAPSGVGPEGFVKDKNYCDGADQHEYPWCVEVDWIESNGVCGGATTLHTIPGTGPGTCNAWGCRTEYHNDAPKFHMRIDYDDAGHMTVSRDGQPIAAMDPAPQDSDYDAIKQMHDTTGAVIYSSLWTGNWVPGPADCGPGPADLTGSAFTVSNLKIQGSVVQGPEPQRCSSSASTTEEPIAPAEETTQEPTAAPVEPVTTTPVACPPDDFPHDASGGQCNGLIPVSGINSQEECKSKCCMESLCQIWQFGEGNCFIGASAECGTNLMLGAGNETGYVGSSRVAPVAPTTQEPTTVAPVIPTTQEPTTEEPTTEEPTTVAPMTDPTTQEPVTDPTTQEPTTTGPTRPTPSPQRCHTCSTYCAPCKECKEGPEGSFAYGSCEKCWHCWDWDDDELEDDDDDMDKDCDALHKDHDWDDEEVRCLTNDHEDCRACWAELGEMNVYV